MRDPFKPHTNKQLIREAQFGFTVIGLLVATLIYVAWFRLGAEHQLPDEIRSSSTAMQVYPNSPNYDHATNEMVSSVSPTNRETQAHKTFNSLAHAPQKMIKDSQRTARSLSKEAASIDESVTKVASLIKPSRFGPVKANSIQVQPPKENSMPPAISKSPIRRVPATPDPIAKSGDFKPLKLPVSLTAPRTSINPSKGDFDPAKMTGGDFAPAKIKTSLEPKTSSFVPFSKTAPLTKKAEVVEISPALPIKKPESFNPIEALKAIVSRPKTVIPSQPSLPNEANEAEPPPSKTQPTAKTEQPQPSTVQTVSFDSTRWKVKSGDSFWSIAQESYGDGRFFRALYETNRSIVPGFEDLGDGVEIDVPPMQQLVSRHPSLCPADAVRGNDPWRATPDDLLETLTDDCDSDLRQRLYETKAKDTLFSIAQRQLGQASRYVELIELNRFRIAGDTDHQTLLPAGTQLLLPDH